MSAIKAPAKRPCGSCPYRQDVPSGVWDPSEYAKLPGYDQPTAGQPLGVFLCHQQNGRICAGWAGCHDMAQNPGLRMASSVGILSPAEAAATLDYQCPIPLFESGQEAAEHGMAEVLTPGDRACRVIDKLTRKHP